MKPLSWNAEMTLEDQKDLAYWERNMMALMFANYARHAQSKMVHGWYKHQGDGFDGWSRVISLCDGKMTFHVPDDFDLGDLPEIPPNWDGHTTEEKWARVMLACGITPDTTDRDVASNLETNPMQFELSEIEENTLCARVKRVVYELLTPTHTIEQIDTLNMYNISEILYATQSHIDIRFDTARGVLNWLLNMYPTFDEVIQDLSHSFTYDQICYMKFQHLMYFLSHQPTQAELSDYINGTPLNPVEMITDPRSVSDGSNVVKATTVLEREYKFRTDSATWNTINFRYSKLHTDAEERQQTDTYFDTVSRQLNAAGQSLRLRHLNNDTILTIKKNTADKNIREESEEVYSRLLVELPVDSSLIRNLLNDNNLSYSEVQPVITMTTDRTIYPVSNYYGTVDVCFDHVTLYFDGKLHEFYEIEFELKSGHPQYLDVLVSEFQSLYGEYITPSVESKLNYATKIASCNTDDGTQWTSKWY